MTRFSSAFFVQHNIPFSDRYGIYCTAERLARLRSVSVQDIFSGAYANPQAAERLIGLAKALGEFR